VGAQINTFAAQDAFFRVNVNTVFAIFIYCNVGLVDRAAVQALIAANAIIISEDDAAIQSSVDDRHVFISLEKSSINIYRFRTKSGICKYSKTIKNIVKK